jgi:hypothetical protein
MAQLVLQPDAAAGVDTHLVDAGAEINYDLEVFLRAGTDHFGKSGIAFYRPLVRFDVGGLPAGATVDTATLTLFPANGALPAGATFHLYRVTQTAWTESGATWNKYNGTNSWASPGGDYTTSGGLEVTIPGPSQDLVFSSLKNLVDDAIANRGGFLHLILIGPETGSTDNYYECKSSDDGTPETRPRLVIDYTPMGPPTISVADHGDNTGATATVSGAGTGTTNVVFVQDFSGDLAAGTWTSAGSVVGNGNVELDLPVGHYFAYAASSLGSVTFVSSVVYFVVTDGQESLHTRCLSAAQARIRSLALDGISNENVVIRKVPVDRYLATSGGPGLPAIVLSPRRTAMPPTDGTNSLDDVHYDVLVAIFDRDNQEPTLALNLDRHLLWREQIARAFRNQRLTGVPQVINAHVEPADGLLEDAWKHELMTSALLVRFTSRETRGFN